MFVVAVYVGGRLVSQYTRRSLTGRRDFPGYENSTVLLGAAVGVVKPDHESLTGARVDLIDGGGTEAASGRCSRATVRRSRRRRRG